MGLLFTFLMALILATQATGAALTYLVGGIFASLFFFLWTDVYGRQARCSIGVMIAFMAAIFYGLLFTKTPEPFLVAFFSSMAVDDFVESRVMRRAY